MRKSIRITLKESYDSTAMYEYISVESPAVDDVIVDLKTGEKYLVVDRFIMIPKPHSDPQCSYEHKETIAIVIPQK